MWGWGWLYVFHLYGNCSSNGLLKPDTNSLVGEARQTGTLGELFLVRSGTEISSSMSEAAPVSTGQRRVFFASSPAVQQLCIAGAAPPREQAAVSLAAQECV